MNSKKRYCNLLLAAFGLSFVLAGCVRDTEFFETDDNEFARKQTVRIVDAEAGEVIQRARNVSPAIDTFLLLELRRDPNNEAELNQAMTVKVVRDTSIIGKYNRAHGSSFLELPPSTYTVLSDLNNITFQPGEISKQIMIRLDKNQLDLSKQYALGLRVTDPSGGAIPSVSQGEVLYAVGVKNKYDGRYKVTGSMTDFANSALTGLYPLEWELVTSGPNSVVVYDNVELGFPGHMISNAGSPSYYGSFGLVVNFDPVTNIITSVTNFYGQPAGNTRSAELDPSGVNKYDPASKSVKIKYFMKQPSVVTTPPNIRTAFDETWEYIGPR